MIANLIIIAFVLGMAYIWSVYGLFSAFLQLVLVICAGSIAFAVWEPVAIGLLIERFPHFAWGIGLLLPFVIVLGVFRGLCDTFVRGNVHFPRLVNAIGGAACGLLSGILIAGIAWIGINFLPLKPSIGGAQNYQVSLNGLVTDTDSGGLWFRVDKMAAGFFGGLSDGAFSSSKPLKLYQPKLAWQAGVYRLQTDPNGSYVATPTGVAVEAIYAQAAPIPGLDSAIVDALGAQEVASGSYRVVVVDTRWSKSSGTYDADSALRLAPSQVRLVAFAGPSRAPQPVLIPPRGYARVTNFEDKSRAFNPLITDQADVRTNQQAETFGFVFLVPADAEPQYMLLRHLRVDLPAMTADADAFKLALGTPPAPKEEEAAPDEQATPAATTTAAGAWSGQYAQELTQTNALAKPFNRNNASSLRYYPESTAIESGETTATGRAGGLAKNTRVDSVYIPGHFAPLRMKVSADTARGIFGNALNTARSAGGVWLVDQRGQQHLPVAYVLVQGDSQLIHVDLNQPIQSANQLPTSQMSSGNELYLYFAIPKPTTIVRFQIGDKTEDIEPPLELK